MNAERQRMLRLVLDHNRAPYSPSTLFRKPEWDAAILDAPNEEKNSLIALYHENRAHVTFRRRDVMRSPGDAVWRRDWESAFALLALSDRVDAGELAIVKRTVWRYGEEYDQPTWLPARPPGSRRAYFRHIQDVLKVDVAARDFETWAEVIGDAPDHAERKRLMDQFTNMLKARVANGTTYRPEEAEAQELAAANVAAAVAIGFLGVNDPSVTARLPGVWHYRAPLGAGGQGTATLWVQYNANAIITQREVLKDTYLRDGQDWDNASCWFGNVQARQPLEYALVRRLNGVQPAPGNIVRYDAYHTYVDRQMYRMYMEFAEHGTLLDLIQAHRELVMAGVRPATATEMDDTIPNRLLWCIFEALAAALCFAHKGRLPNTSQVPPAGVPLFHRDIKPGNVFLAGPDTTVWPSLPVPKIADWGMLMQQSNPLATLTTAGTPGWRAPESLDNSGTDYDDHTQAQPADIWSVERVMLALANLHPVNITETRFGQAQPSFHDSFRELCPPRLAEIIEHCLQELPADRPSCNDLWTAIQVEVASPSASGGPSMRTAPYNGGETLLYQADKYVAWGLPPTS